jgi:hypothetical protein
MFWIGLMVGIVLGCILCALTEARSEKAEDKETIKTIYKKRTSKIPPKCDNCNHINDSFCSISRTLVSIERGRYGNCTIDGRWFEPKNTPDKNVNKCSDCEHSTADFVDTKCSINNTGCKENRHKDLYGDSHCGPSGKWFTPKEGK